MSSPPPAAGAPGPAARTLILLACAAGLSGLTILSILQVNPFGLLPPLIPLLLYLSDESMLLLSVIPVFFLLWSIPQFRGKPELHALSIVLPVVLTLLLAVYFVLAWEGGVEFEGLEYTVFQALMNAGLAATAFITVRLLRKRPSWPGVVAWKAGIVGWLTLIAFPYLGETP